MPNIVLKDMIHNYQLYMEDVNECPGTFFKHFKFKEFNEKLFIQCIGNYNS